VVQRKIYAMDAILTMLIIGLIVYALVHIRRNQTGPRSRLAGSSHVTDRDIQRLQDDLRSRM
jgi:hypothetical protein